MYERDAEKRDVVERERSEKNTVERDVSEKNAVESDVSEKNAVERNVNEKDVPEKDVEERDMYKRDGQLVQKKFKEYLIPTLLTSMAVSMSAVLDSIIVGNLLGDAALAAVSLSMPIVYGMNMIFMLFGVGGLTCAVVAKGRREGRESNMYFTLSLVLGTIAMMVYLAVTLLLLTPITTALSAGDAEMQILSAAYLMPLLFTAPFLMISSGTAFFIRTDGRPKMAAAVTISANIVKLIFSLIFIQFMGMGIAGAGLSTTVGYFFGVFLILPYIFSKNRSFKFVRANVKDLKNITEMLKKGFPKSLMQGTFFLRSVILNSLVMLSLGSLGMSAMAVCMNVLIIANIFINGTSDTLLPIVGTLYGEKDNFGIRKIIKDASVLLVGACIALAVFFAAFPEVVGGWFGVKTEESMTVLVPALRLFVISLPFLGINTILQNFYNTTGREKLSSAMVFFNNFIFVAAFALLLIQIDSGLIWLCYACAEITTIICVLLIGMRIARKEKVLNILLIKENQSGVDLDVTIPATIQASTGLSQNIIDFCKENGIDDKISNRIGVAIEEMATNTTKFGGSGSAGSIDVRILITETDLTIRFRDDGIMFDPTAFKPDDEENGFAVGGIEVVKRLAGKIEYTRQIGFNTTVMTFEKNTLENV
ncbi:ATP-binding protein [Methanimicrococcus sp. OttesenSCG-928-J09]|nr:ATP-binding protein [Methanimicrococcus sp. OttesenSCG-928-J09]